MNLARVLLNSHDELIIGILPDDRAAVAGNLFLCHEDSPSDGEGVVLSRSVHYTSSGLSIVQKELGESLEPVMLRIYLSGRMMVEADGALFGPQDFPAQQGRAAFALLVGERGVPVARSVLVAALWPERPPRSWNTALSSIISKLRALLFQAGVDGPDALRSSGGCYELRLPTGTWIDHEVAANSIHEAETALKAGDPARAYGPSAIAHHIARRPFLPEAEGQWFEHRRQRLANILVRALECRAEIYLWNREHSLAVEAAREVVALQPFRETGYQLLMRANAAMGNAAEALRVYERCRALIVEELGVGPSRQTKAVHMDVLHSL